MNMWKSALEGGRADVLDWLKKRKLVKPNHDDYNTVVVCHGTYWNSEPSQLVWIGCGKTVGHRRNILP